MITVFLSIIPLTLNRFFELFFHCDFDIVRRRMSVCYVSINNNSINNLKQIKISQTTMLYTHYGRSSQCILF